MTDHEAELARQKAFTLQLAERLYIAFEVLQRLAERREPKGDTKDE